MKSLIAIFAEFILALNINADHSAIINRLEHGLALGTLHLYKLPVNQETVVLVKLLSREQFLHNVRANNRCAIQSGALPGNFKLIIVHIALQHRFETLLTDIMITHKRSSFSNVMHIPADGALFHPILNPIILMLNVYLETFLHFGREFFSAFNAVFRVFLLAVNAPVAEAVFLINERLFAVGGMVHSAGQKCEFSYTRELFF